MKKTFKELNIIESKNINGGRYWGGPIVGLIYEIADVITSAGENLKTSFENGKQAGCGGDCDQYL